MVEQEVIVKLLMSSLCNFGHVTFHLWPQWLHRELMLVILPQAGHDDGCMVG